MPRGPNTIGPSTPPNMIPSARPANLASVWLCPVEDQAFAVFSDGVSTGAVPVLVTPSRLTVRHSIVREIVYP